MYLSGGQACSKYRKTKDPKCEEQDGCQWVKGKGCTGRSNKVAGKKASAKASSRPLTVVEFKIVTEAEKLSMYNKRKSISARDIQTGARLTLKGEFAQHAVSEGTKFTTLYKTNGAPKLDSTFYAVYDPKNLPVKQKLTKEAKVYLRAVKNYVDAEEAEWQGDGKFHDAIGISDLDVKRYRAYRNNEPVKSKKHAAPRSYKKDRPSPSESAKTYNLGTTKKGNDGKMWTVVANKNGVKRWKRN